MTLPTIDELAKAIDARPYRIEAVYPHLTTATDDMGALEASIFIAQLAAESQGFLYAREIWGPTKAQAGYEGRTDLGNTEPGDGFRFRGRGYIMVTGRANYAACGAALGLPLLDQPEMLEQPAHAMASARWFWNEHGCRAPAQAGDFRRVTRLINGGFNGYDTRLSYWNKLRAVMGVKNA